MRWYNRGVKTESEKSAPRPGSDWERWTQGGRKYRVRPDHLSCLEELPDGSFRWANGAVVLVKGVRDRQASSPGA